MDIDKLVAEIIPPNDRIHRAEFYNIPIIDKLNDDEKKQVADKLIKILSAADRVDSLIIETLAYLKSGDSLPVLYEKLKSNISHMTELIISSSIFEINGDSNMIDIGISAFIKLDRRWKPFYKFDLINGFYYLAKFLSPKSNDLIGKYIDHKDFLVSHNARKCYITNPFFLK